MSFTYGGYTNLPFASRTALRQEKEVKPDIPYRSVSGSEASRSKQQSLLQFLLRREKAFGVSFAECVFWFLAHLQWVSFVIKQRRIPDETPLRNNSDMTILVFNMASLLIWGLYYLMYCSRITDTLCYLRSSIDHVQLFLYFV